MKIRRRFLCVLSGALSCATAAASPPAGVGGAEINQPQEFPGYCLTDWTGKQSCFEGSREPWKAPDAAQSIAEILAPEPVVGGKNSWRHVCGGVLVAPDWVLTAAHCLPKRQGPSGYAIRFGFTGKPASANSLEGVVLPIKTIVRHPNFRKGRADIALVQFDEDPTVHVANPAISPGDNGNLVFPRGAGVKFPAPGEPDIPFTDVSGKTGRFNGNSILYRWNRKNGGPAEVSATPLFQALSPLCDQQRERGEPKFDNTVFCALSHDRPLCPSDSGAPVMGGGGELLVVAVATWDKDRCAASGEPGRFTLTGPYRPWIRSVLKESYDRRISQSGPAAARRTFNPGAGIQPPAPAIDPDRQ